MIPSRVRQDPADTAAHAPPSPRRHPEPVPAPTPQEIAAQQATRRAQQAAERAARPAAQEQHFAPAFFTQVGDVAGTDAHSWNTPSPVILLGNGGGNLTVTGTAETSVMTTPVPAQQVFYPAGNGAMIWGHIVFVPGTGATAVQVRIRRGAGLAGAALGPLITVPVTAGATAAIPYGYEDIAFGLLGQNTQWAMQYSVTLQQVGASANGTVTYMTMMVNLSVPGF